MNKLIKLAETIKDIAGKIKDIAAGINKAILYGIILVSVAINLVNLFLHTKEHIVVKTVTQNVLKTITITNTPPIQYINGKVVTNTRYITIEQAQDEVNQWHTNLFTNDWKEPYLTVTLPNSYGDRWEKVKIDAYDNYRFAYSLDYIALPCFGINASVGYRFISTIPLFVGITAGYDASEKNFKVGLSATFLTK
jgi:hypothetical protein